MTAQASFGQWFKQRRKSLDLTREYLAQRIGCAAITLKKIESDERRPSRQIAELLAEHLNIPPDERPAFVLFARSDTTDAPAPWGTPFHPPTNLTTLPVLIGREEAIAGVYKRLLRPEARLLTLIGPPGIGKTSLALAVAAQAQDDFADGVFLVELAPISDASLVLTTIASSWLKLLVTSRAPLRIRLERQLPVAPLALPEALPDIESLSRYAAITLFVERAQAVQPDFSLTLENAQAVVSICTRLDGLPLAIELISARIKLLAPAALLERLHGRLMLEFDGLQDLEPRHRTLNAAIEWSYQLLNSEEQTLFRRLGIFVGGGTLEAVTAICFDNLSLNPIDGLTSLLDKNLIRQTAGLGGEPRFLLLETLREYSLAQVTTSGELDELRQHHTEYFLQLAEGAEAHAFGLDQIIWFDRLEIELDNLRAALAFSSVSETGLRLAGALGWFFLERTHWNEGFDWLERIIAANPTAPVYLRAKVMHTAGALAWYATSTQRAQTLLEQALTLARTTDDRWNIAWSLSHLGNHVQRHEIPERAALTLEASLTLFRELGNTMGITHALVRRAWVAMDQQDYLYVGALLEEAESLARQAGDRVTLAWITHNKGMLIWHRDHDLTRAKILTESSLQMFRNARFQMGVKNTLGWLGALELERGNVSAAQAHNQEFLSLREIEPGDPYLPGSLVTSARIARARGQFERAVQLFGAADQLQQERGYNSAHFAADLAMLREQLDENVFAKAWAAGKAMSLKQTLACASGTA